ncbi:uncharacterized protein LOC141734393 [Larus michahellis]|uniref:uncharacterized protein LOC141734393 n=1 Tax=Larus michahellis TaxID=119627 RepID=UPI003D9BF90D
MKKRPRKVPGGVPLPHLAPPGLAMLQGWGRCPGPGARRGQPPSSTGRCRPVRSCARSPAPPACRKDPGKRSKSPPHGAPRLPPQLGAPGRGAQATSVSGTGRARLLGPATGAPRSPGPPGGCGPPGWLQDPRWHSMARGRGIQPPILLPSRPSLNLRGIWCLELVDFHPEGALLSLAGFSSIGHPANALQTLFPQTSSPLPCSSYLCTAHRVFPLRAFLLCRPYSCKDDISFIFLLHHVLRDAPGSQAGGGEDSPPQCLQRLSAVFPLLLHLPPNAVGHGAGEGLLSAQTNPRISDFWVYRSTFPSPPIYFGLRPPVGCI